MEIFKLFGSIFVNTDEADKSMQKTEKSAESIATKFSNGIKTAAKWGTAITAGAAAAGGAVFAFANKSASAADNIDKMSQKIGISREAYQELDFVCSQSGTSVDTLQMGIKTLTNQMQSAADGTASAVDMFDKLGLSIYDSQGQLKDQETMMWEAMSALQGMENQTEKAALANDLFGRSGSELMPLLNGASGSIEEMRGQAHELGLVIGDEAVDAGVKFTDKVDQLKRSFSATATAAGTKLLPSLTNLVQLLIDKGIPIFEKGIEKIESIVNWFTNLDSKTQKIILVIAAVVAAAGPLLTIISTLITVCGTLATVIGALSAPVLIVIGVITALIAIGVALYKNWDTIKAKATELKDKLAIVFQAAQKIVFDKFNAISDKISKTMAAARDAVYYAIEKIKGFFHFEWSLPKIKMPHFSISGSFSLKPPSVPSFNVDWYDKAMKNPLIMTKPTAFGINSKGQIMAGGESGSEVVSGADTLMNMISAAVENKNERIIEVLIIIRDILIKYLPELANMKLVMDTGATVGALVAEIDDALGRIK